MQKGAVYNFYKDLPGWAKGASVLIVLGIGVVTYFSVRKWIKNRPPSVHYPNGGEGIPVNFDAKKLAQNAYKAMKGINLVPASGALLPIIMLPTSDMFVAVYDVFNQLYMHEGEGTFREWVNDEAAIGSIKGQFNNRFDQLNLK